MPKRKLADRILDEILALRRPRPLMVEVDEGMRRRIKVLEPIRFARHARRQMIVE